MPKITYKHKLKWCLQHYDTQGITSKYAAKQLGISQRRLTSLQTIPTTGKTPNRGQHVGRTKEI